MQAHADRVPHESPVHDARCDVLNLTTDGAAAAQLLVLTLLKSSSPATLTQAGPGALEGVSSKLWLYQSLANQAADDNSGLVGPILITSRGKALPDGRPNDVDTEFVTVFKVCPDM